MLRIFAYDCGYSFALIYANKKSARILFKFDHPFPWIKNWIWQRKHPGQSLTRVGPAIKFKIKLALITVLLLCGSVQADEGPTLVYYFRSDCDACKLQGPEIEQVSADLSSDGLKIIGVSLDTPEKFKNIKLPYPIVRFGEWDGAGKFGPPHHIPMILYIDKNGKLVGRGVGYFTAQYIEESVKPLLK